MLTVSQAVKRKLRVISQRQENEVVIDATPCLNFSGNDYLNLTDAPEVKQALSEAATHYGLGSGSSPQVSGYHQVQQDFERAFAKFIGAEKSLLFSAGTLANQGAIRSLCDRKQVIIADKLVHASILDGIHLSRARYYRYRHQDLNHLESLLQTHGSGACVITEGVFSMAGDVTPIKEIANLCQQYQAKLYLDDAHGFGILGLAGRGTWAAQGLDVSSLACLVTPLGKAFASCGGIVSGSAALIDQLIQKAGSHRYNTALPPALSAVGLTLLDLIEKADLKRGALQENCDYFNRTTKALQLPLLNEALTPIRSVLIRDNDRVMQIQAALLQAGFMVAAIRPPTVPTNTARLRISLNSSHQPTDLKKLIEKIACLLKPQ